MIAADVTPVFVADSNAQPGNVLPALARLLIGAMEREFDFDGRCRAAGAVTTRATAVTLPGLTPSPANVCASG